MKFIKSILPTTSSFVRFFLMIASSLFSTAILFIFFGSVTSYVMNFDWSGILTIFSFLSLYGAFLIAVPLILFYPIMLLSKKDGLHIFEKIILSGLSTPAYINFIMDPWYYNVEYTLANIILASALNLVAISIFSLVMYGVWCCCGEENNKNHTTVYDGY